MLRALRYALRASFICTANFFGGWLDSLSLVFFTVSAIRTSNP